MEQLKPEEVIAEFIDRKIDHRVKAAGGEAAGGDDEMTDDPSQDKLPSPKDLKALFEAGLPKNGVGGSRSPRQKSTNRPSLGVQLWMHQRTQSTKTMGKGKGDKAKGKGKRNKSWPSQSKGKASKGKGKGKNDWSYGGKKAGGKDL